MLRAEPLGLLRDVPLAPLTTLELGGAARHLVVAESTDAVTEALRWARAEGLPIQVLGGGSNVVVADGGYPGLVLRPLLRGIALRRDEHGVTLVAAAGEPWDEVVAATVAEGLAGLECLSGIPGLTGATPVQNVGAYGQEVADAIAELHVIDRATLQAVTLRPEDCAFSYRDSLLRRQPDRFVVLGVAFRLRSGGVPTVRYPELARLLAARAAPGLADVREAVLELRRSKSMVLDPTDPNRRSVGSFFTNPVLEPAAAAAAAERAVATGALADPAELPSFTTPDGRAKVSAAWLVEHAGFPRGFRRGPVGVSSRHALALVHHGGGSTADLLALATDIRAAVWRRFGVVLEPEPALVGFADTEPLPNPDPSGPASR